MYIFRVSYTLPYKLDAVHSASVSYKINVHCLYVQTKTHQGDCQSYQPLTITRINTLDRFCLWWSRSFYCVQEKSAKNSWGNSLLRETNDAQNSISPNHGHPRVGHEYPQTDASYHDSFVMNWYFNLPSALLQMTKDQVVSRTLKRRTS